jgi:MFS family permease
MTAPSARLSLLFSSLGHFYVHMFTAFYFTIVLRLEAEWGVPFHELVELWFWGSLLVGLAALPAGWLGDNWSNPGMMVVFFLGLGGAAVACGMVSDTTGLLIGLSAVGLFAAIYHPIGIPWLLRSATTHTGKVMAVNGIFGSLGAAAAGLVSGVLMDLSGWRLAFIAPGLCALATGLAMLWFLRSGRIADAIAPQEADRGGGRGSALRAVAILMVAMFAGGVIYHSTQTALPKLFAERLHDVLGSGAAGVGLAVAAAYTVGGVTQLLGGYLADRYPLKPVFIGAWTAEMAFLVVLADATGLGVVGVAMLAVMANLGQIPAENMMLARYAPQRRHGVVFGLKFVLMFGAAPLSVALVSRLREATGGFEALFYGLGAAALAIAALALLLPPVGRPVAAATAE